MKFYRNFSKLSSYRTESKFTKLKNVNIYLPTINKNGRDVIGREVMRDNHKQRLFIYIMTFIL